ncbi:MAG: rod shape-determining protein RodA [Acidobacteriia bacterium]|nr:rod shape-determining protein RodA [Terriglobia bacterium]
MLTRRFLDSFDFPTMLVALALGGLGVLAIASATLGQPARIGLWHVQLVWLAIGTVAALVVVGVDYHVWAEFSLVVHGLVVIALVTVLFFGREVAGNRSWLVVGPLSFQPSEVAKWSTCLVLAAYLSERVRGSMGLRQIVEMGVIVGLPTGLVAAQPDTGTALTFVPIYLAALLLGGLRWKVILIVLLLGALLAPVGWGHLKEYQKERILNVLDPERDPSGIGYQTRQSKIAVGSGKLTGKGLFRGTQSHLNFLPAQHTDFILAVVSEELGFAGAATVLALFYALLYRGVLAARSAQDRLGSYLSLLVLAWITGQLAINVGMVLGLMPTIGVPLPLMSYGGTALVSVLAGVGLIVNVRSRRFVN